MMKKYTLTIIAICSSLLSFSQLVHDSVFMGPSYRNEVYYNLTSGFVDSVNYKTWDLAFSAIGSQDAQFYAILANHSNGVKVYKYPKSDMSGWNTFDTSGWNGWRQLWNTDTSWSHGAFNRNPELHPIYSWGVYTNSGEITGDSLYLLGFSTSATLPPTTFKKLWIVQRRSSSGSRTWEFRYANLNGSGDTTVTMNDADYANKFFAYYSIRNNQALNREPNKDTWDIVFTKYFGLQPDGVTYYDVTGVLQNRNAEVIRVAGVPLPNVVNPAVSDTRFAHGMGTIGWDWKTFNNSTFKYEMKDSLTFFVKTAREVTGGFTETRIYKLQFTQFAGSATGKIVFGKEMVYTQHTATGTTPATLPLVLYPNPASSSLNLVTDVTTEAAVTITGITGKTMLEESLGQGFRHHTIDISGFPKGVYVLNIRSNGAITTRKFIVQ